MKKIWGPLSATALLALSLTACGGVNGVGNAYKNNGTLTESRGTVTENNKTVTNRGGVTDFGDTGTRSMMEEASDALENGVRRARDGLENAKETMDNDTRRTATP